MAERGGETFVDALATHLSEKNEVVVFQAGEKAKKPYQIVTRKLHFNPQHHHSHLPANHLLKRLFLDYFSLKILWFTLKIVPDLIKLKPDIIYPLNSGWEVLLVTMISRIFGIKVIIGGHSGPGWNDRVNLLFHPDAFIALTKTQAEWARKASIWKHQEIFVIPNGVSGIFSPKGEKRVINLPEPIILAVGAASKSKRLKETIKAVAKLKNVSLLICGTGPDEKEEDELGTSLLGKRYLRLKVTHADMPSIYRTANAFTLCSDSSEAFGIVYLEALASGLPCVVTDDASRHEILGSSGIYVKNPSDSKEYAAKIKQALTSKTNTPQPAQAAKYSWKKIASQYQILFKKLLLRED